MRESQTPSDGAAMRTAKRPPFGVVAVVDPRERIRDLRASSVVAALRHFDRDH
jgi:hypothetical protein